MKHLDKAVQYVDSWLDFQCNEKKAQGPGLGVCIIHGGKVLLNKGYGYANMAEKEPMGETHLFRIASHSKTLTGIAFAQLVEKGECSYDDPVSKYLPSLLENPDQRIHKLTIRQMLTHTSGLQRDGDDAWFWQVQKPFLSHDELNLYFKTCKLSLDPDKDFKYSNIGFSALGMALENIYNLSYSDIMRIHLLEPLGLSPHEMGGEYNAKVGPYVTGHTSGIPDGEFYPISSHLDVKGMAGATGFYATLRAICTVYADIASGRSKLLKPETIQTMLEPVVHYPVGEQKWSYSLGFAVRPKEKRVVTGHGGGMPGNVSRTFFDRRTGIVVSVAGNSHAVAIDGLLDGIWHILDWYNEEYVEPVHKHEGRFYGIWSVCDFIANADRITAASPAGLTPFSGTTSFVATDKDGVFFIENEEGHGSEWEHVSFDKNSDGSTLVTYGAQKLVTKDAYLKLLKDF